MNTVAHTFCPACETKLARDGMLPDELARCVNCGQRFELAELSSVRVTSRKARFSLYLGIGSLIGMWLTGIPAIVYGILALREIRRKPRELKGRSLAIVGIASGSCIGLLCGGCISVFGVAIAIGISTFERTSDPAEVAQRTGEIVRCEFPAGMKPTSFTVVIGMKIAEYQGPHGSSSLMLLSYSHSYQTTDAQLRRQFASSVPGTATGDLESITMTIDGADSQVTRQPYRIGIRTYREYVAILPSDTARIVVILRTMDPDSPIENSAINRNELVTLTDDQVRSFLESFRL